jgi:hypothetical protein
MENPRISHKYSYYGHNDVLEKNAYFVNFNNFGKTNNSWPLETQSKRIILILLKINSFLVPSITRWH